MIVSSILGAICVLKCRKREHEENARIAKGQIGDIDGQESKQEESPGGEDSSDMGESRELDADAVVEGRRNEMKTGITAGRGEGGGRRRETREKEKEKTMKRMKYRCKSKRKVKVKCKRCLTGNLIQE
ncbi:hypothetical protein ACOSQ3_004188 [Xanthoceras sorbifolium]